MSLLEKKYYSYHITQRFLVAMDTIIGNRESGKVTARAFGQVVGMNSSNITRLRSSTGQHAVTIEAIGKMVEMYKVSPAWLFSGEGEMFGNKKNETIEARLKKIEQGIEKLHSRPAAKRSSRTQTKTQTI